MPGVGEEAGQKFYMIMMQYSKSVTNTLARETTHLGKDFLKETSKKFARAVKGNKQSIKKLVATDSQLQDIPIDKQDLSSFQRELKKDNITFAVKKDPLNPDTYMVFFKSQDVALVDHALKRYVNKVLKQDFKPISDSLKQDGIKFDVRKDGEDYRASFTSKDTDLVQSLEETLQQENLAYSKEGQKKITITANDDQEIDRAMKKFSKEKLGKDLEKEPICKKIERAKEKADAQKPQKKPVKQKQRAKAAR